MQASTCWTVDLLSVGRIGLEHSAHRGSTVAGVSHERPISRAPAGFQTETLPKTGATFEKVGALVLSTRPI